MAGTTADCRYSPGGLYGTVPFAVPICDEAAAVPGVRGDGDRAGQASISAMCPRAPRAVGSRYDQPQRSPSSSGQGHRPPQRWFPGTPRAWNAERCSRI